MGCFNIERIRSCAGPVLCLLTFVSFLIPSPAAGWNHSEIRWKTIVTPHFSIHFHEGEDWTAGEVAKIAEEIYQPVTSFYGYEIGRVHINVYDVTDRAEGLAAFYLNRIDINASDYEFHFRGTSDWLRNVLTHEFTHLVSIQTAMKLPLRIPAVYLQAVTFEKEKRPDVITGYPNFQGSIPFSGEIIPNWLAEGTAQFQCTSDRNDIWDSHRDMLLRMAVLSGNLHTIDEMGVFGKNSIEAEMVYNQGYSLVRFIAERYGEDKVVELVKAHSKLFCLSSNRACKCVLGISEGDLYREWVRELEKRYSREVAGIGTRRREGEYLSSKGYMNMFPFIAGSGGELYYLSNMGRDYMSMDLVRLGHDGKPESVVSGLSSRASYFEPGRMVCYAKRTGDNPYGYELNDIYLLDIETGKEKRVTHGMRATDPSFSADGRRIAAVESEDGSERIVAIEVDTGKSRYLTPLVRGRRYYGIAWVEKGILTSRFDGVSRDIVLVDPVTGGEEALVSGTADERDPCWDADNNGFLFSSDRTGIFNIYHLDISTGSELMITNVVGGAFSPYISGDDMLFTGYGARGYEIRTIRNWIDGAIDPSAVGIDASLAGMRTECYKLREKNSDGLSGAEETVAKAEKFDIEYTPLFIFPRFLVYDKKPRIGLAFNSMDLIDRQSLYAAASINKDKEFNLQFGFDTRQFKPTFSFIFLSARKYYDFSDITLGDVRVRYDLWDAYFMCKMELEETSRNRRKEITLAYNHGEYGLNINAWDYYDSELGWNYYKANEISLFFDYRSIRPGVYSDINPRSGRTLHVELTRAYDKLSSGYFEYAFKPIYDQNDFGRYILEYEEFIPLPLWSHVLSFYAKGGTLDENLVDDFFYLYLGSYDGLRGYSYYSLGGRKIAMARLTYRFPLFSRINKQYLGTYLASLYAGIFAEAGKAWNEDELDFNGNNKDIGFELRLKGFTFYNYPLAASFTAAYGLDKIEYNDPFQQGLSFTEGEEWKYYGSILFDF